MASVTEYEGLRTQIKNGDLILFRGKEWLAKQIQYFDDAYYNHVGMVFESNKRLFILDSNAQGVNPDLLSDRMNKYTDFCIVRPSNWNEDVISNAVSNAMERAQQHIKYDFTLLLELAIYRKTGKALRLNHQDRDICSEFARRYLRYLDPVPSCYENVMGQDFITPWDYIIYADEKFEIHFDVSDRNEYRKKL